ncbi:MAG: hypothetical protein KF780_01355 [Sphingomonas sp.]|nr:hypothetical protein [Sphingomonas sp.]
MRRARVLLAGIAALWAVQAIAQEVVTSAAPERVAVTVYRDPERDPDEEPNLDWLNGYALISETRTIAIPAGESTIRFEGVAGGILPQSAIITGFPEGIIERNRDALLLSPATLIGQSLGRRVHLRRTSNATGEVREQEAVIRSGADGALVLQTAEGFEALRCTGLAETLVLDGVPAGLSARPTLSVRARAGRPVTATVTLSYLASGFDWQANYLAHLSEDGRRIDLFAWLTLASQDETSFPNADTQAVAGNINREDVHAEPRAGGALNLQCWPQGRTSDIASQDMPQPAPPAVAFDDVYLSEAIIVTGSRMRRADLESSTPIAVVTAEQEDLGDLKLYRIPEPVTVAANAQKQVALMTRPGVRAGLVYRSWLMPHDEDGDGTPAPTTQMLVTRNRTADGLGLPLPAGGFRLFAEAMGRPILIGEGFLPDRAVENDVEIELDEAPGVTTRIELVAESRRWRDYRLVVASDRPVPVRFEAEFMDTDARFRPARRLARRNGRPLWATDVPANGIAALNYRIRIRADGETD